MDFRTESIFFRKQTMEIEMDDVKQLKLKCGIQSVVFNVTSVLLFIGPYLTSSHEWILDSEKNNTTIVCTLMPNL